MNIYRLTIQPTAQAFLAQRAAPSLTTDAVTQLLADAAIQELTFAHSGHSVLEMQLPRASHSEALDEIAVALQQLGYAVINATVSQWATEAAGGAVLCGLGGAAAGSTSQDSTITLLAAICGVLVGAWAGARVKRLEVIYDVHWSRQSGWVLIPRPQPAPSSPAWSPGFTTA